MTKAEQEDTGGMVTVSPLYPNDDVLKVIGEVCFLCFHSTLYQSWSMTAIAKVFEPPIYLKQFHVYRAHTVPRGLVTWAKLSPEAEAQHMSGKGLDEFEDWRSGDQFWIMDLMAPWGHGKMIINDLLANLPTNDFKTLRERNGKLFVVHWTRKSKTARWKTKTHWLES